MLTVVPSVALQGVDCNFLLAVTPTSSLVMFSALTINSSLASPELSRPQPEVVVKTAEVAELSLSVSDSTDPVVLLMVWAMLSCKFWYMVLSKLSADCSTHRQLKRGIYC